MSPARQNRATRRCPCPTNPSLPRSPPNASEGDTATEPAYLDRTAPSTRQRLSQRPCLISAARPQCRGIAPGHPWLHRPVLNAPKPRWLERSPHRGRAGAVDAGVQDRSTLTAHALDRHGAVSDGPIATGGLPPRRADTVRRHPPRQRRTADSVRKSSVNY